MYKEDEKIVYWETFGFGNNPDKSLIKINLEPTAVSKPKSAWWGSRIDASFGWKHYCKSEGFRECREDDKCVWTLSEDAKILKVSRSDLTILNYIVEVAFGFGYSIPINVEEHKKALMSNEEMKGGFYHIDFDKIVEDGYDAVELLDPTIGRGIRDYCSCLMCFSGWDCESIVVLNPEKIVFE